MNIVAANQHLAVHEHSVLHSSRLEQTSPRSAIKLPASADNPRTFLTTYSDNTSSVNTYSDNNAQMRPMSATPELSEPAPKEKPEQKSSTAVSAESTTSTAQNEDKQSLNELQTIDAVERILDQLSTGKLLSWIDGNSLEKIQAQVTEQQRAGYLAKYIPAFTAQAMASSFGLDDGEALLNRIALSGIFLNGQNPMTVDDSKRDVHQVDLNI